MNEAARILVSTPWLTLATVGADGAPLASYAPFALFADGLGIAVSRLSAHTAHLFERRRASVLVVADEPGRANPYARPRITIEVIVRRAMPDVDRAAAVWDALEARHGGLTQTLRALPDFEPFVLEPVQARLILGFGSASDLDAAQTLAQIAAATALQADSP